MDDHTNSWWHYNNRHRNKHYDQWSCTGYLYIYSYQCSRMYFICICKCGDQCTTSNTNSTNSRNNYTAYMCGCNWISCAEWVASIRYMDHYTYTWWSNNNRNRN